MAHVVNTAHRSNYPDPIRFSPGDRLVLGRCDDEYPGWIRVGTQSGNEGWAPETLIRVLSDDEGVTIEEYTARELNTRVGQSVLCQRELNGWVWVVDEAGESGWIPLETVTAC